MATLAVDGESLTNFRVIVVTYFGSAFLGPKPKPVLFVAVGIGQHENFQGQMEKIAGKMFTAPATLMSCQICWMTFWLKLAVSELKLRAT